MDTQIAGIAEANGWFGAWEQTTVKELKMTKAKSPRVIAESDRLILREFTAADLDDLAPILADPEVMRFSVGGPFTRQNTAEFLSRCQAEYQRLGFWLWAVVHKKDRKLIGYSGLLEQFLDGQREIEVAYRLATAYWGQGLGTEAARLARDAAFRLGFKRVISLIEPANIASIRVAEKNGLRYEKDTVYHHLSVRVYALEISSEPGVLSGKSNMENFLQEL